MTKIILVFVLSFSIVQAMNQSMQRAASSSTQAISSNALAEQKVDAETHYQLGKKYEAEGKWWLAEESYAKAATQNHAAALCALTMISALRGEKLDKKQEFLGITDMQSEAMKESAYKQGNIHGLIAQFFILIHVKEVNDDDDVTEEIRAIAEKLVGEKDALAQYYLWIYYKNHDFCKASYIEDSAVRESDARLLYYIGSEKRDRKYIEKAAELGFVEAQFHLDALNYKESKCKELPGPDYGSMLYHMALIHKRRGSSEVASRLIRLAADHGHMYAQLYLADMFEKENNKDSALHYYGLAADAGNNYARYKLALFHEKEGKKDEAKRKLVLAADGGNIKAQVHLANMFEQENDEGKAMHYGVLAADAGDSDAQYRVAYAYKGKGNRKKAKHYFALAAGQGNSKAQVCLAYIYGAEGNAEGLDSLLQEIRTLDAYEQTLALLKERQENACVLQ
jgi:TPR repeat protein